MRENDWSKTNGLQRCNQNELKQVLPFLLDNSENLGINVYLDALFISKEIDSWLKKIITKYKNCYIENFGEPCHLPWVMTSILSNGDLFACCGDFSPIHPGEGDWFNKIFNDRNIVKLRQNLACGIMPCACLDCRGLSKN